MAIRTVTLTSVFSLYYDGLIFPGCVSIMFLGIQVFRKIQLALFFQVYVLCNFTPSQYFETSTIIRGYKVYVNNMKSPSCLVLTEDILIFGIQ